VQERVTAAAAAAASALGRCVLLLDAQRVLKCYSCAHLTTSSVQLWK
jgi:hypothetical protein